MCFSHMSGLWDSCRADTETRQSPSMALPSPPLHALGCIVGVFCYPPAEGHYLCLPAPAELQKYNCFQTAMQ